MNLRFYRFDDLNAGLEARYPGEVRFTGYLNFRHAEDEELFSDLADLPGVLDTIEWLTCHGRLKASSLQPLVRIAMIRQVVAADEGQ